MSHFACVLARTGGRWRGIEISLDDCESVADVAELARDEDGEIRIVLVEQDDEYAAVVRVDDEDDEPRAFLSDAHAADVYPVAAMLAADLEEVGDGDDDDILEDTPPVHESAPLGDAQILEDLGTSAADLLAMCAHEGTLPVDLLVAVCEKAGCGGVFDELRA